jgi:hypothetical protein
MHGSIVPSNIAGIELLGLVGHGGKQGGRIGSGTQPPCEERMALQTEIILIIIQ